MRALLDINVLIALLDASHQHHEAARDWMIRNIREGWASCPITQNGFIRILSQPSYVRPVPVAQADLPSLCPSLRSLTSLQGLTPSM